MTPSHLKSFYFVQDLGSFLYARLDALLKYTLEKNFNMPRFLLLSNSKQNKYTQKKIL